MAKYLGIEIDYERDRLIPEQGLVMLTKKGFYKREWERSPQESFARAATCFCFGDYELAQRIYDHVSLKNFTFASPVLSNAIDIEWPSDLPFDLASDWLEENKSEEVDGMPISCFLNFVSDTKESLVRNSTETRWLSMNGGGVGTYFSNRSPDEKSTGVMAHVGGYNADTIAYRQTSCYLGDTEILTDSGWKKFSDVDRSEKVAMIKDDGSYEFVYPEEWLVSDYEGDIYNFSNKHKGFDLHVTANHNMVVERKRADGWTGELELVRADNIKCHNEVRFLTAPTYNSGGTTSVDAFTALRIAHQADGYNANPKHGDRGLEFHFSKDRKIKRLKGILDELGLEYSTNSKGESTKIYVKHAHLPKNLDFIQLDETSPDEARCLLDEISLWDGHNGKHDSIDVSSIDKYVIDKISALAALAGLNGRTTSYQPANAGWKLIHSIHISKRAYFNLENLKVNSYEYSGKVYCCTVPSGKILVRSGDVPIVCGNSRRGSIAAYMDIDHPEVLSFLETRNPVGGDQNNKNFNINNALNITDDFMIKMIKGEKFELIDPKHGNTGRFLDAREVWEKIGDMRYETGEPYLNFIDTVNRNIPKWIKNPLYKVSQSNLCSEITLMTSERRTAVCCLSSLNVENYDQWKDTGIVADLTRFLDNVLEYFIRLAPEELSRAVYSARKERAIGIGTLGVHAYFQSKGIPFEGGGFNSSVQHTHKIYSDIKAKAQAESMRLGTERGESSDCRGSGMRNSHLMALAPNASSSSLVNTSPSAEPWAANAFNAGGRAGAFLIKNVYLEKLLESKGKNTSEVWKDIVIHDGSVQHLDFLSDTEKAVFRTSFEIDQRWIIELASIRQEYLCQSQSVNLFLPPGTTAQYMSDLNLLAWHKGLKSLYYCRSDAPVKARVSRPTVKLADPSECIGCD